LQARLQPPSVSQKRPPSTQKNLWHTKTKTRNSKTIAG
jgi:hypothetical protein